MFMTLAEKILAFHSGKARVTPGEIVFAKVDLVMGTDVTVPLSVHVFQQMGVNKVFDRENIAFVNDHFVPAKDIKSANFSSTMRAFASEQNIAHFFEVGRSGICHVIIPDSGLVKPGDLVVGADSHTCTYGALGAFSTGIGSTDMAAAWALGELWFRVPYSIKVVYHGKIPEWVTGKDIILHTIGELGVDGARYGSLEFHGEVVDRLSIAQRFTICNMAIESGAKCGLMEPNETVYEYLQNRCKKPYDPVFADHSAEYVKVLEIDVSQLEPQVAFPYLPSNSVPISKVDQIPVDQVVVGSCTNGRLEDFRIVGKILKGRKIADSVRMIAIPATQEVYLQIIKEGIAQTLIEAGAVISPPTCGPCIGGHMGVLAKNEVGLFTTNRNFVGRNGDPSSKVYLCNPAVAAASAIHGKIYDPRKL
jgi:3-isopropylmalate/(R)-2-methylmalate dehydratase large subunit